ncbi:hypothetical protein CHUAL_005668 [Chamberlinius hualienensis]
MASQGKFFRITHSSRSRARSGYQRQSFSNSNDNNGTCPYQAKQPQRRTRTPDGSGQRPPATSSATIFSSSSTPKFSKNQCNCCLRKFTLLERLLSLGQKRCQRCRKVSCKHCISDGSQCHLCAVRRRNDGTVTPQYLLTLEDRDLVGILHTLHYRDTDFVGWPKPHLVKQILTRLDIYNDWNPATAASTKSERKTSGKSPKRRKRQQSNESKRVKTAEEEQGDIRTIDLIDVMAKEMKITETKVASLTEEDPKQHQSQPVQTQITVAQERPVQPRSSKNKLSKRLRQSMYGVTPTVRVVRKKSKGSNLPIEDLCKICMDALPNCVFLNCGHMVTCNKCAHSVQECPICRSPIVKIQKVYKS